MTELEGLTPLNNDEKKRKDKKEKIMKFVKGFVLAVLALLFASELVFSSLAGLFGDTAVLAQQALLDLGTMRLYLILLGLLDFAGVALVLTTIAYAYYRREPNKTSRFAQRTAVLTLIYAVFQASAGIWLLADSLQGLYLGIAATYGILALAIWLLFVNTGHQTNVSAVASHA